MELFRNEKMIITDILYISYCNNELYKEDLPEQVVKAAVFVTCLEKPNDLHDTLSHMPSTLG